MKNYVWLSAGLALVAAALVAGCGGGGSSSTTAPESGSASTSTSSSTTTEASGDATPDDVYNACLDALKDVGSQDVVQQGCSQARDAFQQCATAASNAPEGSAREQALSACQDAANKTVEQLQSSP
jgi:hypothetical protein